MGDIISPVMGNVRANGIRIEYDTFGDASGRPLVLVMGPGDGRRPP